MKDLINHEESLNSDIIPFGAVQVLGNQSIYGVGGISSVDFDNPSILLTTPTTPPSSTSAVLSNEGNPFQGGSNSNNNNNNEDDRDNNSSDEDDPPLETDFKKWPGVERGGEGAAVGVGSEGTESWWSSQFEKPRESDSSGGDVGGGSSSDNMWSDKVSSNGGSASDPEPSGKSTGKNGLGVPKGVVTLSPTILPAHNGNSHDSEGSETELEEKEHHTRRGSASGK